MPHGAPDYWGYSPKDVTHPSLDVGELAARLGSPVSFDRRGSVVWYDSFINGMAAWEAAGTSGYDVYPYIAAARTVGMCLRMETAATTGAYVQVWHDTPPPMLGGWGWEVSFIPGWYVDHFDILLLRYTGEYLVHYEANYNHNNGNLYILKSDNTWVQVGSPGVQTMSIGAFSTMKLVVDALSQKYDRLLFNGHTYDISSYEPFQESDTSTPRVRLSIRAYTDSDAKAHVNIDDVIFTQEEPIA